MTLPHPFALAGDLPERLRLGADFYGAMARERGDVARIRLGTWSFVLLSHPDAIAHVLQKHPERYAKGETLDDLRSVLGSGLFFADGERWRDQRRMLQPSFRPGALVDMLPQMGEAVDAVLPRLEEAASSGQPCPIHAVATELTLDFTTRALFGSSLPADERRRIGELVTALAEQIDARMFSVLGALPLWVPLPVNTRILRSVRALDAIVQQLVSRRRAEGTGALGDLLDALLDASDADGEPLSDAAVRDQVMTFFLTAHETTASALAWTVQLLAEHPEWLDRIAAEAEEHGPPTSLGSIRTLDVHTRVFRESLRLYPPGWTLARVATEDDVIDGQPIAAGTHVMICPYALHRDARFWTNPEHFDPDRFPLDRAQREAWIPFGAGPRACIGGQLSTLLGVRFLSAVGSRFRFETVARPRAVASVTLRPEPSMRVRVRLRSSPQSGGT